MDMENITPFIESAVIAIAIAFATYLVAYLVGIVIKKTFSRLLGAIWSGFVGNLVSLGILLWGAKIILDYTGAAGALVILATALTGALAIGSERMTSDILGGLTIFFAKPFEIGQFIGVGEHEGEVIKTTLTTTHLNSYQGPRIILRNSTVIDNTIVNYDANPSVRISTTIPVPAGEDLEKAAQALDACLASFEPQATDHKGSVVCDNVNMGYAEFKVRVYIPTAESFSRSRFKLFVHAARALKNAGVSMKA